MSRKKKLDIPILKVPKDAGLRQICAIYRKQFSAADLQKYTEIGPMVPAQQLLAELEAIDKQETAK